MDEPGPCCLCLRTATHISSRMEIFKTLSVPFPSLCSWTVLVYSQLSTHVLICFSVFSLVLHFPSYCSVAFLYALVLKTVKVDAPSGKMSTAVIIKHGITAGFFNSFSLSASDRERRLDHLNVR